MHATCVAFGSARGILIVGPSGAGKSALALQLMALGAALVSDDRTMLTVLEGAVWACAAPAIRGLIEARGVGLLRADPLAEARLVLVIDMGRLETDRMPPKRLCDVAGIVLPMLHKVEGGHFPAAILYYISDVAG